MFRYSTIGGDAAVANDASVLMQIVSRLPRWDEMTIYAEAQFPRAGLSWHEDHGIVFHCFEDEHSSGFFLAETAELSRPQVDIVLGGHVQERWPPQLFVSVALGVEAVEHFLKTGKQKKVDSEHDSDSEERASTGVRRRRPVHAAMVTFQ